MTDWAAVKERVARLVADPSRRSDVDVLTERAERLAVTSVSVRPSAALEVVLFELPGGESYGIESPFVVEVFRIGPLTPLPHAPSFVRGLTNRLGEILPVLDLAPLFGLAAIDGLESARCVLIGRDRRPDFALLVSRVVGVALVPEADLLPLPEGVGQGAGRDFVRGVTAEALIVLDGDRILRDPRLVVDLYS